MNQPLRLLLVTKSTGGVAEYVRQLVNGFDRGEFRITVACLSENGPEFAAQLSKITGVKAFSLRMNRYKIDPFSDMRALLELRQHIRRDDYDLIHAHASKPGFLARLAALGTGVPVLYSPHCFSFHAGTGRIRAGFLAALERLAARYWTARIVAIADGERKLAQKYRVGADSLFVTVHTGIDSRLYQLRPDIALLKESLGVPANAILVGAVGRLSKQKAPLDFVRMAAIVHKSLPNVHFAWVGSGPLLAEANALSTELQLNDCVHFVGQRTDIAALYHAMDCFVLPSLWEGFPLVLLEAMACGVPVVATNIPGNDEAIRSGKDGLLTPVNDPGALAQACLIVLSNPLQAQAFQNSAQQRVQQEFTPAAMLRDLSEAYRQVVFEKQARLVRRMLKKDSL